jgi:hypothetical protein
MNVISVRDFKLLSADEIPDYALEKLIENMNAMLGSRQQLVCVDTHAIPVTAASYGLDDEWFK